ncbi:MAG: hypothetical protein R3277_09590 [Brumimicrobium sp.]|nr:hypothetical protein [Brumimicrobium sp.]
MYKLLYSCSFLLAFSGCISSDDLKPIVPMQIFHANSAKVWVLEGLTKKGIDKVPRTREMKTAFVLYNDGGFLEQKIMYLGSSKGITGKFGVFIDPEKQDTLFSLYYKKQTNLTFLIRKCESGRLELQQVSDSREPLDTYWTLTTLPKPYE